jgi:hypothetical protein
MVAVGRTPIARQQRFNSEHLLRFETDSRGTVFAINGRLALTRFESSSIFRLKTSSTPGYDDVARIQE